MVVNPADPSDLYNLSKLLGESLCLALGRREIRVARLSNVWGFDTKSANFVPTLVRDALAGRISLQSSRRSCKDYIGIGDVVAVLPEISRCGSERIYNVACGENVSHGAIVDELVRLTDCEACELPDAPTVRLPAIDTTRIEAEFDWHPRSLRAALPELVEQFRASGELGREGGSDASLV